jgi:Protein of unknown function (DUF3667)
MSEELLIAAAAATLEDKSPAQGTGKPGTCHNCSAALGGPFCHVCGQKHTHLHKPIWELAEDFLHTIVHFDSRMWLTLRYLFLAPGRMTNDWLDGRQARHMPPIRLFVFTSMLLVLALAFTDVVLVQMKGHLSLTSTGEKGSFSVGICSDDPKSSKDCVKSNTTISSTGTLTGELFQIADKKKKPTDGIDGVTPEMIEDKRALKAADYVIQETNKFVQNPKAVNDAVKKGITTFILIATPLMALILKLFYTRQKKYLVEHLVFALHVHTFFFASFLICILLVWISRGWIGGDNLALALWLAYSVHFLLALKRTYGQGWMKTILKSMLITGFYFIGLFSVRIYYLVQILLEKANA